MRKAWMSLLLAFCLLLPAGAMAGRLEDLWVTGAVLTDTNNDEGDEWDAIHWWYSEKEKEYYLFLPACADPGQLTLHFTGAQSLEIDGQTVLSGEPFAFVPGSTLSVDDGNKTRSLCVLQSRNVPALFIRTESGNLEYIHRRKGNGESGELLMAHADGSIAYEGDLSEIKGRGNATFQYNKKPYQIKLDDKTDLCGMGEHKTWILLANYRDNSLLRNTLTFSIARNAGLAYTPKSVFCDLYINQQYYGTYELCTKVQIGSNRIEIQDLEKATEEVNDDELESYKKFGYTKAEPSRRKGRRIPNDPEDITGGYLLELEYAERYDDEASGYTTRRGQPVVIKEPEYASDAQTNYISTLVQRFENGLRAKDGVDAKTGMHYSEFMDLDSFATKYIVEEVVKNYDGNKSSQYFYKPQDSLSTKLIAGPVWDYDSSWGNYNGSRTKAPASGFGVCTEQSESYYWYPAAYRHADFRWRVQELYAEVFVPVLETLLGQRPSEEGLRSIDEHAAWLEASAAMNFKRWPVFNIKARPIQTGANYAENIEYIRNFLTERMAFLNEAWLQPYQDGQVAAEP